MAFREAWFILYPSNYPEEILNNLTTVFSSNCILHISCMLNHTYYSTISKGYYQLNMPCCVPYCG